MKFTLATKEYMTQLFDEQGRAHPATVLTTGPVVITQVKTPANDGYAAVQVGFGKKRESKLTKPERGHLGERGAFAVLKEFRVSEDELGQYKTGDKVDLSVFAEGDVVAVSAHSKGKGFQGVVKRHGFKGGPRSHGQKHNERAPGSIGAKGVARTLKNTRMPGRMGNTRTTIKNLKLLAVDADNNQLMVKGAVPGRRGTLVEIRGV